MRNNDAQTKSDVREFRQTVDLDFARNSNVINSSAFLHEASSDLRSSARIGSRRISRSNSSSLLVKTTKFAGMNGAMLRSGGTSSGPAFGDAMVAGDVEDKLSIDLADVAPIKDGGSERVSYRYTYIRKEQSWSLNSEEDRGRKHYRKNAESEVFTLTISGINNGRKEHSKTEEITQSAVHARSMRSKDNRISTGASQNVEW